MQLSSNKCWHLQIGQNLWHRTLVTHEGTGFLKWWKAGASSQWVLLGKQSLLQTGAHYSPKQHYSSYSILKIYYLHFVKLEPPVSIHHKITSDRNVQLWNCKCFSLNVWCTWTQFQEGDTSPNNFLPGYEISAFLCFFKWLLLRRLWKINGWIASQNLNIFGKATAKIWARHSHFSFLFRHISEEKVQKVLTA